jgi:eukaryotic-like serine/threonine-protein kinase
VAVTPELIDEAATLHGVTLVSPLRQGGQKTVLLAERPGGIQLVLKVIAIGGSQPDALRRARREVELLARTDHPNVVKVASDLAELRDPPEGAAWLEEYLDGDDLVDLIGSPWDWPDVKRMGLEVAEGLAVLHADRVVHRDLSANNVRRRTDGTFVVMDPGWARHLDASRLTVGGQPGTPGYVSPEHLNGYSGAPTPASDVFCVGILMFVALTGQLPIPYTGDLGDYVNRLTSVTTLDLAGLRPELDAAVIELVNRCLHPQPARRYRNGRRLADALSAAP